MSEQIIQKKLANYFVPSNEAVVPDISSYAGNIGNTALSKYIAQNGLWIGGTISLSTTAVSFQANAMNAELNEGNRLFVSILLGDIKCLGFNKSFVSSIVSVNGETDSLVFRCFGAKKFLGEISKQAPHAVIVR